MSKEYIQIIAPIITIIPALVLSILAFLQLKQSSKSHSASVIIETSKIMRKIRPKYQELWGFPDDFHCWDSKQNKIADLVGTELQRISYLCMIGLVDKKVIMDLQGKVLVDSWEKSKEWTKNYREKYHEPREIKEGAWRRIYFESFADECRKYLTKKGYCKDKK